MQRVLVSAIVMIAVITLNQPAAANSNAAEPADIESGSADNIDQEGVAKGRMKSMPLTFTENKGQWDGRVELMAEASSATIWFTTDGICYQFTRYISKAKKTQLDPTTCCAVGLDMAQQHRTTGG